MVDGLAGAVLLFSPEIFGFLWLHAFFGIMEIGTVLMTKSSPNIPQDKLLT
jgi:hypothetical protein